MFSIRHWFLRIIISLVPLTLVGQINTNYVLDLGRNALFFENYMLSIQYFNRVIEAKPYLAQPFFFRAIAKLRLEDYTGVIADGTAAIERNAFLTDAYGVRAIGYIEAKEYKKAVADYLHLLEQNPREGNALYNLSLCYMRMKDYNKAEETLAELTHYATEGKERIALMKADCAINKGDTLLAIKHINESLAIDSLQENAWAFKGELSLKKGNYKEAEFDLTKAIKINNKEADLFIERAFTLSPVNLLICYFYNAAAKHFIRKLEALLEFLGYYAFTQICILNMHYGIMDRGVKRGTGG